MERPEFGSKELIEQLKKQEDKQDFEESLSELFIESPLPWRVMGYLVAGVAKLTSVDYDMDKGESWKYFKAGYELFMDGGELE